MTPPSSPDMAKKVVKLAPLEIQTTQEIGIPVPIGPIINQVRANPNQAVVVDEPTGLVALVTKKSTLDVLEHSLQDTTIAGVSVYS